MTSIGNEGLGMACEDVWLACREAPIVVVRGGFGSGKTLSLANAAAQLVSSGVAGENIAFVTARSSQVAGVRSILEEFGAPNVRVESVLGIACDVLGTPEAISWSGRRPRLALPFEIEMLEEDLKTLGSQPRRLHDLLKFLYRGLGNLDDRDPEWLFTIEEKRTLGLIREELSEEGAILPCEAANLALAYLEANPEAPRIDYVLADDFTSINKAGQRMLEALAGTCLVAAGSETDPGVGIEQHPFSQGLDDLVARRGGEAVRIDLGDTKPSGIASVIWGDPALEAAGIAQWVAGKVGEGAEPCEFAVVAPNQVWAKRIGAQLDACGVANERIVADQPWRSDPRKPERNAKQKDFCLQQIAADKTDLLAWRAWCGFDDTLLGSQAWTNLRTWANDQGIGLAEALLGLTQVDMLEQMPPFVGALRLAGRVKEGLLLAEDLEGSGDLIDAVAEHKRGFDPAFESSDNVLIGTADVLCGTHRRFVLAAGLVDGFFPGHDCFNDRMPPDIKQRNLDRGRVVFERLVHQGIEATVLSRFDHEMLVEAEPARMEIKRIWAKPQGRLATIKPSTYLVERAADLPAALEGAINL